MDQAASLAANRHVLTMVRRFPAPPDAVFRAWIQRDQLASWLGVPGRKTDVELFEPRVGGAYRVRFSGGDMADAVVGGVFRAIEPPGRLVLTWTWEPGGPCAESKETLITVTFRAKGTETEMTLQHEGFESEEWAGRHEHGWTCGFENLAKMFAA